MNVNKLSIPHRLFLAFSCLLLLVSFAGGLAFYYMKEVNSNIEQILGRNVKAIDLIVEADRDLYQALVAERSLIFLEPDSPQFSELLAVYKENSQQSYDRISQVDSLLSNKDEKQIISEYFDSRVKWEQVSWAIIDALTSGNKIDQKLLFKKAISEVDSSFQQMRNHLDRLTELNLEETEKFERELDKNYRFSTAVILTLLVLSLVFGIIISYSISRSITQPLKKVVDMGNLITKGNIPDTTLKIDGEDELAQLARMFNELVKYFQEKNSLMKQLHHSQKMDAIGQLAGGVAHDFNNTLAGVLGTAEMLKEGDLTPQQVDEFLDLIIKATRRSSYLTRQLLAFSRKSEKVSTNIDISVVVDETIAFLKRSIDKSVEIIYINEAKATSVCGDNSLIQNALINMGINAWHAMPNGGTLTLKLTNCYLDKTYCKHSSFDLREGNYLQVDICDTGAGISLELQEKIFEPFFTTKGEGKGTGLGLAAVYGMVQEHEGAVTLYSEVGVGTEFHIYLPLAEELPDGTLHIELSSGSDRCSGTILLIDDEELIRISGKAILQEMGYTVLLAENGKEGVEQFHKHMDEIDLVIMDMIMPVMNGREAFQKIRKLQTEVPIIISSGFSKDEDLKQLSNYDKKAFLRKPFRRFELYNKLKSLGM